jgi:hypothetical protein
MKREFVLLCALASLREIFAKAQRGEEMHRTLE